MISPSTYVAAYARPLPSAASQSPAVTAQAATVQAATVQAASGPDAPRAAARPGMPSASLPVLSAAERQALAQHFPEVPALAQRLYGPAHAPAPPPALGTRLDLRG